MPPASTTTKVNEQAVLEETEISLTLPKAHHLIAGLDARIANINSAINGHLHQVKHPSFMNPQVEHHQLQADLLIANLAEVINLRSELAATFDIELDQIVIQVIADEPTSTVTGPGEQNRPPSANPGATSANRV